MKSFFYALRGIWKAFCTERNMRVHLCAAFYVLCAGWVSRVEARDWPVLILCIALVMGMELLNTAVERLCDALHPEWAEKIGWVKDAAAGAVLLSALGAAVAGGLIFFREARLQAALESFQCRPLLIVLALLSLAGAVLFIRGKKK